MTDSTDFAALFEDVTGQSTVTDHQQTDLTVRLDDREEADLTPDRVDATTAHDFDDVDAEMDAY